MPADRLTGTAFGALRAPGGGASSTSDATGRLARAETLAAPLPPLLVAAERVAATVSQGVHGRKRVGQGEAFWQFRPYQAGDSAHKIDWRRSARSDRFYVRQTEWEAAESVWLWRDASPSMRYRSQLRWPHKIEAAELLMMAVASLLSRGGEHLAWLGSGLPPATGRSVLIRMASALERDHGPNLNLPSPAPLPRYARLVLFGDFLAPLEDIEKVMRAFASRGVRGHLVCIVDPVEEDPPFTGRVIFEGLEAEPSISFGRAESIRTLYREAFAAHHEGLRALASSAGWTCLTHRIDMPPQAALLALYTALSQSGKP